MGVPGTESLQILKAKNIILVGFSFSVPFLIITSMKFAIFRVATVHALIELVDNSIVDRVSGSHNICLSRVYM